MAATTNSKKRKHDSNHNDEPPKKRTKSSSHRAPNVVLSFPSHLTLEEASKPTMNDRVDHRDRFGRFVLSKITGVQGSNLKIHHEGWSTKWDVGSDFNAELHRFAAPRSLSKRPGHRFMDIKVGDPVDINPMNDWEWKRGEIKRFDQHSGRVQVRSLGFTVNVSTVSVGEQRWFLKAAMVRGINGGSTWTMKRRSPH